MKLFCSVFAALCLLFAPAQKQAVPTPALTPVPISWPKRIPILMYHYVEYVQDKGDTIRQSLAITPSTFSKQIETLLNAGYTFITARELGEMFDEKRDIPDKPILMTFDDGYRDFYTDVYPVIEKYHVKATVYVISGFIGYKNYMNQDQITVIAKSGLVDIGSHTVHHAGLASAPRKEIQKELSESKITLETLIGAPIVSFAYPDGKYDDMAIQEVSASGYTTAVTTKQGIEVGPDNRFSLVRIRPGANIGADLLARIAK